MDKQGHLPREIQNPPKNILFFIPRGLLNFHTGGNRFPRYPRQAVEEHPQRKSIHTPPEGRQTGEPNYKGLKARACAKGSIFGISPPVSDLGLCFQRTPPKKKASWKRKGKEKSVAQNRITSTVWRPTQTERARASNRTALFYLGNMRTPFAQVWCRINAGCAKTGLYRTSRTFCHLGAQTC